MEIILTVIGILVLGSVILIANAILADINHKQKIIKIVDDAIRKIKSDNNSEAELENIANNLEYRNTLYDRLKIIGKENFFPKKYYNQQSFAESDIAFWLNHPNELNKTPDEIKLIERRLIKIENDDKFFLIFKFRVKAPHWAFVNGWMGGIVGPYNNENEIITQSSCTWSEIQPLDKISPEMLIEKFKEIYKIKRA